MNPNGTNFSNGNNSNGQTPNPNDQMPQFEAPQNPNLDNNFRGGAFMPDQNINNIPTVSDNSTPTFSEPKRSFMSEVLEGQGPQQQAQIQMQAQAMQQPIPMNNIQNTPYSYTQAQIAAMPQPKQSHALEILVIVIIYILGIAAIGGAIYFFMQYDAKNKQITSARNAMVVDAKEEQKQLDDQNYAKRKALTSKEFTGPSQYGSLTFKYPKEWNVYIANESETSAEYEAYFHPDPIPPVKSNKSIYAFSFRIVNSSYEQTAQKFTSNNKISTVPFSSGPITGIIAQGKIKNDDAPNGRAVIIKVNDKSAILQTDDYTQYGNYFDSIIASLRNSNIDN